MKTHPSIDRKTKSCPLEENKGGCCQTNWDYKPTPRRLAQDSQTRISIKLAYLNHRLTASSPPSLCTEHYRARASLQTRRRYLCDPCLLASTSSSFLPQPTEQSRTSQCQQPLGQHLRPYVTLTLRLSSCPEHLIPAFGSQHQPMLPEVRLCCRLAPCRCQPPLPHPFSLFTSSTSSYTTTQVPFPPSPLLSRHHPPLFLAPAPVPYECQAAPG